MQTLLVYVRSNIYYFYSSSRLIFWPFSSGRNTGVTTLYRLQLSFLQSLLRTDPAPSLINSENFLYFYFSKLISILRSAVSSTKIYYQKMLKPAFCVWMHVLLIRVHRNWKLAKSLIGNDLAPTEDRSRQRLRLSQNPSAICCLAGLTHNQTRRK